MNVKAKGLPSKSPKAELGSYLAECRELVAAEIRQIVPNDGRYRDVLYDLMFDYPLREGKGLRPALSIASCRAIGGKLDAIVPTAAVLELYHNAFLIHDDIEDESLMRRGKPTLHREHGIPIAVNVGDAMLSMCLEPLLANVAIIGLGPALRILESISTMTRESVEGQAMELAWMRHVVWQLEDDDYFEMVTKKTGWYSFITPMTVGAIAGGGDQSCAASLQAFATPLAIAFQIRDDVLNLDGDLDTYGKEIAGDIWEGKHTLMLLHMLRNANSAEQQAVTRILAKSRPQDRNETPSIEALVGKLEAAGELTATARKQLMNALSFSRGSERSLEDVQCVLSLMHKYDSITYASNVAERWAIEAERQFEELCQWIPPSPHRDVMEELVNYVHFRNR